MKFHRDNDRHRYFPALIMIAATSLASVALPAAAGAQEREPRRVRVALGPEVGPKFPGASGVSFGPFIEVDIAKGDEPFEFEAPDESFGFPLLSVAGLEVGPAFSLEGKRASGAVGPGLPEVERAWEFGGFVQYFPTESLRLRADIRHGVSGHKALVGQLSADWIMRDGDNWLVSVGPRVALGSDRYQRTYFGVSPQEAAASGLPSYAVSGGVQSVGGTVGFIRRLDKRWSLHSYARYDRLVGDAASSPIVRGYGSRDQFSGGLALGYTFGRGSR
jgi:outer membrane protein